MRRWPAQSGRGGDAGLAPVTNWPGTLLREPGLRPPVRRINVQSNFGKADVAMLNELEAKAREFLALFDAAHEAIELRMFDANPIRAAEIRDGLWKAEDGIRLILGLA